MNSFPVNCKMPRAKVVTITGNVIIDKHADAYKTRSEMMVDVMNKYYENIFPEHKKKYITREIFNEKFKLTLNFDKETEIDTAIITELICITSLVCLNGHERRLSVFYLPDCGCGDEDTDLKVDCVDKIYRLAIDRIVNYFMGYFMGYRGDIEDIRIEVHFQGDRYSSHNISLVDTETSISNIACDILEDIMSLNNFEDTIEIVGRI